MPPLTIDIAIVNWNAGAQLADCVSSICEAGGPAAIVRRVVVVDNASSDGSADRLPDRGAPLTVIRNLVNVGFGAACNQAVRGSTADLLLFLNPDTRLSPGVLESPTRFLAETPAAAVCGVALVGENGRVQRSCCRRPTPVSMLLKALGLDRIPGLVARGYPMQEWPHDANRQVDHLIGAFYLVRTSVFRQVGGFDERFFVYLEDLDLSVRIQSAGWQSWFLAKPRVFHRGGGTSDQIKATRLFYAQRSRLQYAAKHFGWFGTATTWLATLLVEPFIRAAVALPTGGLRATGELRRAYAALWRWAVATYHPFRAP